MNQYDQLSLLYTAVDIFKKAATVASKLIFNDSDYFNANQTGSFASSLNTCCVCCDGAKKNMLIIDDFHWRLLSCSMSGFLFL